MNTRTQPTSPARAIRLGARRWLALLLDLLYPVRCGGCGAAGKGLWCESCDARAQRLLPHDRMRRVALTAPWESVEFAVASAALFAAPLREAIHALKYDGTPGMSEPLARLMGEALQPGDHACDAIVPVPLHPARQRERGYNQSELLARQLGGLLGAPLDGRVLRRARHTHYQAQLGAAERRLNVQGAFVAVAERARGKRILLVDDVLTTGATLGECAMALIGAGATYVSAITLARAT